MARPNWEYVRVDVLLPSSRKLDDLSFAAKWTLIELWCHCGQHLTDGFVRDAIWRKTGPMGARKQILAAGLAGQVDGGYQMHDYLEHQRSRAEVEALRKKRSEAGRKGGHAKANAKQVPEQMPQQTAGKAVAEAEAEAEAEMLTADVVDHPSRRNAHGSDDLTDLIIGEIKSATGRVISAGWAQGISVSILAGRHPDDPAAYVRAAIRSERKPAERFLPVASSHPSSRTPAEAAFAAGLTPNGRPASEDTIAAIAAQARQALRKDHAT